MQIFTVYGFYIVNIDILALVEFVALGIGAVWRIITPLIWIALCPALALIIRLLLFYECSVYTSFNAIHVS